MDREQPAALPEKPVSPYNRPEKTRLVELTRGRRVKRRLLRGLARLLVWLWTRPQVSGLENFPPRGPALIVTNHLGDADLVLGMAFMPASVDVLAKIDLAVEYPPLGWLLDLYGVIWLHRGQADRRALRATLEALRQGRMVGLAPEGRESLSGALEPGTEGAAYLALKAGVPLLPVTYTGTRNGDVYRNMRRLRRTPVSVTIGPMFTLEALPDWRESVARGTQQIMHMLSTQLPPEYRGIYR